MANFTKTVSMSVNCFGGGPSTKWSTNAAGTYIMTWGTSKWGEGTEDIKQEVELVVSNSISEDVALNFDVTKQVQGTISVDSETSSEGLKSGGWNYVFVSDTTEAENRDPSTYTSGSAGAQAWTSATAGSTNWS